MSPAATPPKLLIQGPGGASPTLILAHGAGSGMDSPFLQAMTDGLVERGLTVVRFEFPYMAERRATGARRPPNREPQLRDTWLDVIDSLALHKPIIGGKSMGGRIASLIADEADVSGLVCLGYPFHPAGKPHKLRTEHLRLLETPTLIVQGERDALGNKRDVAGYNLSSRIRLHWLPDGDHHFTPRRRADRTQEENWSDAVRVTAEFIRLLKNQ